MAFTSNSPEETANFAMRLGSDLRGGDTLLLAGDIGAGKSHFARSLILSRLAEPEDVPSPTFTLVQVYDLPACEIWHVDLYRLTDPDQIIELGLPDAFRTAICLVEWPDRLVDLAPASALTILFEDLTRDNRRSITLTWDDPAWTPRVHGAMT